MKYLGAALAVLVAAAAVLALRYADSGPSAGSTTAAPTAWLAAVPTARAEIPVALLTPGPVVGTRQEAIELGRKVAGSYGEHQPVLINAIMLPYAVSAELTREPGAPEWDGPVTEAMGLTPESKVWLVRMRGTFTRPMGPDPVEARIPARGWMYAIIDPQTGFPLSRGYFT